MKTNHFESQTVEKCLELAPFVPAAFVYLPVRISKLLPRETDDTEDIRNLGLCTDSPSDVE